LADALEPEAEKPVGHKLRRIEGMAEGAQVFCINPAIPWAPKSICINDSPNSRLYVDMDYFCIARYPTIARKRAD
jgi:hypothetical protein